MKKILLFIISSMFIGCPNSEYVQPHPTPIITDTQYCKAAEDNLINLGCPEGQPTKKGKSFNDFCVEKQSQGIFLNPKCLSEITSCDKIDVCTGTKPGAT